MATVRIVSSRVVETVEVTLTDGTHTWTATMPIHGSNGTQSKSPGKIGPKSLPDKTTLEKIRAPWKGTLDGAHGDEIVAAYRAGKSMADIAAEYKTSPAAILGVLRKRRDAGEVEIRDFRTAKRIKAEQADKSRLEKLHEEVMGDA